MEFINYITDNALIMIPALYAIGLIVKHVAVIPDKFIPLILLVFGVAGACAMMLGAPSPTRSSRAFLSPARLCMGESGCEAVEEKRISREQARAWIFLHALAVYMLMKQIHAIQ